jgi:hypothetical protein
VEYFRSNNTYESSQYSGLALRLFCFNQLGRSWLLTSGYGVSPVIIKKNCVKHWCCFLVGHIIIVCGRARVLFTFFVFVCLLGLQVFSLKQHFTVINDVDFNGRENKQKPEYPDILQNRFLRLNRVQLVKDMVREWGVGV